MPGFAQPNLPQITRFLAGLVTNRNPIDTPFSIVGLNIVQHHDALNDGLNTEISAYNTLIRRPGFSPFQSATDTPLDFFNYKDLNGVLSVFSDINGKLYKGTTLVQSFIDSNLKPWSLVGQGNFVYAANGSNIDRLDSDSITTTHPVGIVPLQIPPLLNVNTASKPLYLSDFIPTNDSIGGNLIVSDITLNRTLTITITANNIHFNVTVVGLPISTVTNYTQTDTQTVAAPTTTDVISQTNGSTGTATGTGVSNGILNYYPTQGISTLDFDVAVAANVTLPLLVGIINQVRSLNFTQGGFTSAALDPLYVFVSATAIPGMVASTYYPDTPAIAMELTGD